MRSVIGLPERGWLVQATGGERSSRVAGKVIDATRRACRSVHTVLSRAGIQEPVHALHAELDSEWVGRTEWSFACEIDLPAREIGRFCALRFGTLDGTCEVFLGGESLGIHMTAFVPFDANVPERLRGTRALLELRFKAPVTEVLRLRAELGERPVNGDWTPFCFARTAACSFGWDWGPRVPGVGFAAANFICWDQARLPMPCVSQLWNADGSCTLRIDAGGDIDGCVLSYRIVSDSGESIEFPSGLNEITLHPSRLWQPWERGTRAGVFWRAKVVARRNAAVVDARTVRFAFRRVELDAGIDSIGRRFRVLVNGIPLFAKGANIVPTLLDHTHIRDWRLEMAAYRATGFNMVRVWGGGRYMPHAFYDACDELGILVWQDFMFACATYPEDEPFASLIAVEASHQVRRLARHPSIALWCGGNEDILAWWSWGWKDRLKEGQSWGRTYWLETLPAAVHENDPGTPYWAESPFSGSMEIHPNDPNHGDRHTWDAEAKIEGYRTILPRFSSEFGHQSPPCLATLRAEIPERALSIGSEALRLRQKAWGGDDVQYKPFLEARFRRARGFDEYVAQAQHLQARAMDVAMRWLRANAPRSMGALIWQWNDVWAGHSWSLVDVAGRTKPAWHAVRRACSRALLSIEPTGESGALEVVLMDDAAFVDPMRFARRHHVASIERMDFAGTIRASSVVPLRAAPCGDLPAATMRGMIPAALFDGLDQTRELLVARLRRAPRLSPATWFFADDSCIQLPKPRLRARATVASDGSGFEEFVAQNVIREFWVEAAEREFDRKSGDPFAEELNGENDGDIEVDNRSCWRTLLPGDAVRLMRDSRWWSANSFALQQTR